MAMPSFLKKTNDSKVIYTGSDQFIFYVPEHYFDTSNAQIAGEYVTLLGILSYTVQDKNGKNIGLKEFEFPSFFVTKPSSIERIKDIKLTKNSDIESYRLLKYNKGDEVIVSTRVPQDIANVESFFQLAIITGYIPNTLAYDQLHMLIRESMRANGNNFGITLQMLGVCISEIARDPKDLSKPFRLSGIKDMYAFKSISVKTVPKLVSPHSSITSENWDEAVVGAIINTNKSNSPLQKILMA